jgi:hypothetical protein
MAGTGVIDEDVSDGATFDLEMTGILGKLLSCKGDASVTKTCNLPLNVGSLTYDAIPFPIKKGPTTVKVDIQLSSALPAALASTTTIATAASKSGDKLFCMKIMSSKGGQDAQQNSKALGAKGQSVRPEHCVPSGTPCTRTPAHPECKDLGMCCEDCCWPGKTHFVPVHMGQLEVCGMWLADAENATQNSEKLVAKQQCRDSCKLEADSLCHGDAYKVIKKDFTIEECCAACAADSKCVQWGRFYAPMGVSTCYLSSTETTSESKWGSTCGRKSSGLIQSSKTVVV